MFLTSKTSTTPTHAPSIGFERNESVLYQFRGIMFPYVPYLVQPQLHPLGFGFLSYEGVWQLHLDGCVGRTPTWSDANGTQTFHNTVHQFIF